MTIEGSRPDFAETQIAKEEYQQTFLKTVSRKIPGLSSANYTLEALKEKNQRLSFIAHSTETDPIYTPPALQDLLDRLYGETASVDWVAIWEDSMSLHVKTYEGEQKKKFRKVLSNTDSIDRTSIIEINEGTIMVTKKGPQYQKYIFGEEPISVDEKLEEIDLTADEIFAFSGFLESIATHSTFSLEISPQEESEEPEG